MLSIKVPPLGESIVEATVSRWLKKEGDSVAAGDTVVELDTDKITVEVPALKPGVLARRAKNEGDVVHVDDVLGDIDESAVPATAGATQSAPASSAAKPAAPASPPPASQAPPLPASRVPPSQSETLKSSPAARRIAEERGVDIAAVAGTGRGGVVSKPDVLAATAAARPQLPGPSAPSRGGNGAAPGERETREKMSTRRKRIAENLLQSQHATAHLTT